MKKLLAGFMAAVMLAGVVTPMQAQAADAGTKQVKLVAIGDDLIHEDVYKDGKKNGKYNFDQIFKHVKKDVQSADVAVINQETIFVDKNYSGYPSFGSPKAVGDAIAKAGFDVVTCATNHTMDRGTSAINTTLNFWKKKHPEVKVLGIHKSKKEASKVQVIEKNGIKIAMLNYTYGMNGYKLPSGKSYMVDLLGSESKIKKDIKKAKKAGDIVIVFAHMGTEYKYTPDSYQKKWSKFFANQGVDIMISSHPHVLEPYTTIKGKNGKKMVCYYSLGNFVSGQLNVDNLLGGMANITIVKDAKGTRVKSYGMTPLVTHYSKSRTGFTVYKLSDYTDKLSKKNKVFSSKNYTVKKLKKLYKKIVKK